MKTRKALSLSSGFIAALYFSISLCLASSDDMFFALVCPDDITLECEDDIWNLSKHGYAYVHTYSGKQYLYDPDEDYHMNYSCMSGYITRTWKVYDYHGNKHECTQTIHVNGNGLEKDSIYWPNEFIEIEGCDPDIRPNSLPDGYGYPKVHETECSMTGITYSDLHFYFEGSCKKVVRKWEVIDWCNYYPNTNNKSVYNYNQIIKINNSEIPEVTVPLDITVESFNCENAYIFVDAFLIGANNCGDDFSVINNSPYADKPGDDASGIYPIGTTEITYTLKYGCGYKKSYTTSITVKDKSAPTPICLSALSVSLMAVVDQTTNEVIGGMLEVEAKKFDHKSYHPCLDQELVFSFSPDSADHTREFTCTDQGNNELEVWVTDNSGNQSSCSVNLYVRSGSINIPECQEDSLHEEPVDTIIMANLSGAVKEYLSDKAMEDVVLTIMKPVQDTIYTTVYDTNFVEVVIDSFQNSSGIWLYILGYEKQITARDVMVTTTNAQFDQTDSTGLYILPDLHMHESFDLDLTYSGSENKVSPITTNDIIALLDHLNGLNKLTDPHLLLAADVDRSGVIDYNDVNLLIMHYYGRIEHFPGNNDLIFIQDEESNSMLIDNITENRYAVILEEHQENTLNFLAIQLGKLSENSIEGRTNINEIEDMLEKYEDGQSFANNELLVYPNPVYDQLIVHFWADKDAPYQLDIFDIAGKKVLTSDGNTLSGFSSKSTLNVSHLIDGLYFYELRQGNLSSRGKLIKQ